MCRSLIAAFCLVLWTCAGAPASGEENWTEFRGPGGNGMSDATGLPETWSESENIVWKTPIHDRGWSSPVVYGNQVWVATATVDGKKLYGVCLDRETGKIVHDLLLFEVAEPRFCHPTNSYASCTPVIEAGKVYLHFGSYGTCCVDTATGKKLWERRDFVSDDFRGPGSSPILHDNLLIVNFDGFDYQFIVALDKETGRTAWKKDRNIDYGTDNGDNKKAYCTPIVIEVAGRKELVSPAAAATIVYDPSTGEEIWRIRHGGMNAAARPLFAHGLVYLAAGDGGMQFVGVKADGQGDVTESGVAWKSSQSIPRRGSPLIIGDLLFMVTDDGIATCRDAKTGDSHWKERLRGKFWGSPIFADGRIYIPSQEGVTHVIAPEKEFKLLAENKLDGDGGNSTPAVAGKAIFLRTATHLYRIEKK